MRHTQLSIFIDQDTVIEADRVNGGTVVLGLDPGEPGTLNVFIGNRDKTKAGALAVLAHLTAAVEALPDDPEPLPLMVAAALDPHEAGPYCDAFGCDPMPAPTEIVTAP